MPPKEAIVARLISVNVAATTASCPTSSVARDTIGARGCSHTTLEVCSREVEDQAHEEEGVDELIDQLRGRLRREGWRDSAQDEFSFGQGLGVNMIVGAIEGRTCPMRLRIKAAT
ncbi:uncharacterized protein PHACADRAFT_192582 [Phanerochaete carnosa HHB-10118-sp]|uniref:Uncharacterized protein n=1 Tax=Phanerochaete carnosa (strain HHB-10118-sp) TaxID=650164 RepID=K5WEE6_PHACS|nr:uncharacterized protein PHACADRAFT_192582 [Phanerochaete carnosa HHB-10118-sp]EKM57434.1 hypothetical protein PHACADRAFT_192582 [Phanerochaete carnosa HHB-10118-sp]